ncbi:hypothetical protein [Priestia megaterium]
MKINMAVVSDLINSHSYISPKIEEGITTKIVANFMEKQDILKRVTQLNYIL